MTQRWVYPRLEDEGAWPGVYYVGGREPRLLRQVLAEWRSRWVRRRPPH